jgi:hypothetical protein
MSTKLREMAGLGSAFFKKYRIVVLRAIWRSLCGDIWRRYLSRSSIPTFCGISTGFADSDVSHLPFMACTSSPSEPGLAFMDRVSASNLSCLRQITPQYLRQIISQTTDGEYHRPLETLYIDAILQQLRAEGFSVQQENVARLSPLIYEHNKGTDSLIAILDVVFG